MSTMLRAAMRVGAIVAMCVVGCATAPRSAGEQQTLETNANATLQEMTRRDPALGTVLQQSAGFAVFPSVGKGGALVGGAFGRGVLYENGRPTGFVKLEQASLGATLGGQTFSELIVLRNPSDIQRLKGGTYKLGADVSAIVLTAGAAAAANFDAGVAVFVMPRGGLMVDVSLAGQRLQFEPMG